MFELMGPMLEQMDHEILERGRLGLPLSPFEQALVKLKREHDELYGCGCERNECPTCGPCECDRADCIKCAVLQNEKLTFAEKRAVLKRRKSFKSRLSASDKYHARALGIKL